VRRAGTLVAGLLVVAVVSGGCTSNDPADPTSSPTAPAGASSIAGGTPTPTSTPEQPALVAYRGMWHAFVDASKTSDPDYPALRTYATGDALRLIVSALYGNRALGKVSKGDVVIDPKVTGASPAQSPTKVTVHDCVNGEHWLEYKKNGELWDDKPGGKHDTTATVTLSGGTWKVSSFLAKATGTC
jgi:hypothetical protein